MDQTMLRPDTAGEGLGGTGNLVDVTQADPNLADGSIVDRELIGTTRTFSGKHVIAVLSVIVVLTVAFNFAMAKRNATSAETRAVDNSVLADTAQTTQAWKAVPDGMIATVTAVDSDPRVTTRIRRSLRFRRSEYLRANYSDPKFGNAQIAGRAVLEFGTSHKQLNCRYRDIPGGGELRWITTDSVMLDSLKEWAHVVASSPVASSPVG